MSTDSQQPPTELVASLQISTQPRDRQPIRTTFKLSEAAFEMRAWVAGHFGVSMADSIDLAAKVARQVPEDLIKKFVPDEEERTVRRTLLLSRGALRTIEEKAKAFGLHRDEVLDACLRVYVIAVKDDADKMKELHAEALEILQRVNGIAYDSEKELAGLLGTDDPLYERFGKVIIVLQNLIYAVEEELASGTPIDPDDL